jgi:hypothetical protein
MKIVHCFKHYRVLKKYIFVYKYKCFCCIKNCSAFSEAHSIINYNVKNVLFHYGINGCYGGATTFSTTTLSIKGLFATVCINDTQHNNKLLLC